MEVLIIGQYVYYKFLYKGPNVITGEDDDEPTENDPLIIKTDGNNDNDKHQSSSPQLTYETFSDIQKVPIQPPSDPVDATPKANASLSPNPRDVETTSPQTNSTHVNSTLSEKEPEPEVVPEPEPEPGVEEEDEEEDDQPKYETLDEISQKQQEQSEEVKKEEPEQDNEEEEEDEEDDIEDSKDSLDDSKDSLDDSKDSLEDSSKNTSQLSLDTRDDDEEEEEEESGIHRSESSLNKKKKKRERKERRERREERQRKERVFLPSFKPLPYSPYSFFKFKLKPLNTNNIFKIPMIIPNQMKCQKKSVMPVQIFQFFKRFLVVSWLGLVVFFISSVEFHKFSIIRRTVP